MYKNKYFYLNEATWLMAYSEKCTKTNTSI